MSGRKCGNCRHYEPSPIWRSGWCRNPRLYGPQESHLVRQEELACAHRIGNYWEAAEDDDSDTPGDRPNRGLLSGIVKPLRLFGPGPRLIAATSGPPGGGRFGSGAGGSGGIGSAGGSEPLSSSGSGRDPYGTGGGGGAAGGGAPRAGFGGPGRPDPTGRLPGQERGVSYQPEERYWTDYLRIALPVVGLLLMLGLFWFWAANLIADDDDDEPPATLEVSNVPTATATSVVAGGAETPAGPTETPVPSVDDDPPPPDDQDEETQPPDDGEDDPPPPDDGADEDPPPDDGGDDPVDESPFPVGSFVIVNTDNLNFRPEPTTDSTEIRTLSNGEELEVRGEIESDGTVDWLPVTDENGVDGYVSAEFVELVSE